MRKELDLSQRPGLCDSERKVPRSLLHFDHLIWRNTFVASMFVAAQSVGFSLLRLHLSMQSTYWRW
jgi:hypothetical protein